MQSKLKQKLTERSGFLVVVELAGGPGFKFDPIEKFLKAYDWDGKELRPRFALDFNALGLGRPHIMRFGQADFYAGRVSAYALL